MKYAISPRPGSNHFHELVRMFDISRHPIVFALETLIGLTKTLGYRHYFAIFLKRCSQNRVNGGEWGRSCPVKLLLSLTIRESPEEFDLNFPQLGRRSGPPSPLIRPPWAEASAGTSKIWYGWSDSNRHSLRKQILSLSRLPFRHTRPVSPHGRTLETQGYTGQS